MRLRQWVQLTGVSAFGARFFVHWTVFAAVAALALLGLGNPLHALIAIVSYLAVIVMHELGHAFVAHRLGCGVDEIGVTMLHGWCRCEAPEYEWEEVLIAWGGVAAQFLIAVPVLIVALILGDRDWGYFTLVIVFLGYLNLVVAAINLMPGPGTDGNVAWRIVPLLKLRRRAAKAAKRTLRVIGKDD